MSRHVEGVRHQMFNESTNAVKKSLKKLIKDIEDFLLGKADEVFLSVKRDYESVVLGRQASSHQLPREQRQIRTDVDRIVEGTEMMFKKVVGLELESPEASVMDPDEKEASPGAETVMQDVAMEGVEQGEAANDMFSNETDKAFKTEGDKSVAVEQNGEATAQRNDAESKIRSEESTKSPTPTHHD
jgi:hypothetical protein